MFFLDENHSDDIGPFLVNEGHAEEKALTCSKSARCWQVFVTQVLVQAWLLERPHVPSAHKAFPPHVLLWTEYRVRR